MSEQILSMSRIPSTEAEIAQHLVRSLRSWAPVAIECEVRSHGRARADVVVYADGLIAAIEVKKADWRRAIGQAMLNRIVADRSYIALWSSVISSHVIAEARQRGIGVIAVDETCASIVQDAAHCNPDAIVRSRVLSQLTGG